VSEPIEILRGIAFARNSGTNGVRTAGLTRSEARLVEVVGSGRRVLYLGLPAVRVLAAMHESVCDVVLIHSGDGSRLRDASIFCECVIGRPIGVEGLAAEFEMDRFDVVVLDGAAAIDGIVDLIQALLDSGSAYAVQGDVYFRVRSDPEYGSISHRSVDDMDQGEGVEGADLKEDPLDFALWKAQKPDEDTAWDAPWGRGRPGWHIECSAMAEEELGVGFEIHTGGNDLTFPHHENEAAQTRRARGSELSRIWMHNGMLQMGSDKMSKSLGNITSLADALAEHGRDAVIMFFVGGHYRQPIQFDETTMAQAAASVRRVREAARRLVPGPSPEAMAPFKERFFAALADDFNTPTALAAVWEWIREANRREPGTGDADLREMLQILALDNLLDVAAGDGEPDAAALALLERRETARAARDFAEADRLREELAAQGWQVRDSADGPQLVPIER
jgi:cysteinyl-tRNA synthetase